LPCAKRKYAARSDPADTMTSVPIKCNAFDEYPIFIRYKISGKATEAIDANLMISEICSDSMDFL
jgi:hypothetical protein